VQPPKRKTQQVSLAKVKAQTEEPQHNLVLRLIAGVQNAGAGVKWKKDGNG
jgi:hypothetical protein